MKNFLMWLSASTLLLSSATSLTLNNINGTSVDKLNKNDNNKINFLATADVHAGYSDSSSSQTVNSLKNHLAQDNNRGVIISGDLTGNVTNPINVWDYYSMIKPIANHTLAGFGNHDADSKINQYILSQIVKSDAQKAANLLYYSNGGAGRSMPVYSWNWSGVHFIQVSLAPIDHDTTVDQNNNPGLALTRLKAELQQNVPIQSKMPIVLSFHYGYDEFSTGQPDPWWNAEQIKQFEDEILVKYNVILMLTGHIHFEPSDQSRVYPVQVGNRTINDYLVGTSLYGGYSQVSIDVVNKTINVTGFDATKNDKIVFQKAWSFPKEN